MSVSHHVDNPQTPVSKIKLWLCIAGLIIILILIMLAPPLSKNYAVPARLTGPAAKLTPLSLATQTGAAAVSRPSITKTVISTASAPVAKTPVQSASVTVPDDVHDQTADSCQHGKSDKICHHLNCPQAGECAPIAKL
jgi:hypothetical protein